MSNTARTQLHSYCNQAQYGPVSGGKEASRVMDGQAVVGTGRFGLGRDIEGGSGGGTDGERG